MRAQSVEDFERVLDVPEEDRFFISCRLSHRDQPYVTSSLRMSDVDDDLSKQTQRDESWFPIWKPIILEDEGNSREDCLSVGEIESVLAKVDSALGVVPHDPHALVCT